MVFNAAAKRLLETVGMLDVVLHDWWMYQLVSAVGGAIHYDPQPALKYRQHPDNLIGSNRGWSAHFVRIRMVLKGRFRDWNAMNIAALQRVPAHLIKPQNIPGVAAVRQSANGFAAGAIILPETVRRLPTDLAGQYRLARGNFTQKDLRWAPLRQQTPH